MSRKNSKDWVEIRDTPTAAPPPAPARALQTISGKLEHAKRNHAHRPIVLSWDDAETIKTVLQVAAHLQAELERVSKDRDDWEVVADRFDGQLDRMRTRAEQAEARRRVLEEALRAMLAHYNQAVPPYHRNLCEICQLAERALGEAQEEK